MLAFLVRNWTLGNNWGRKRLYLRDLSLRTSDLVADGLLALGNELIAGQTHGIDDGAAYEEAAALLVNHWRYLKLQP